MIQILKIDKFRKSGIIKLNGKILKIGIITSKKMPYVRVKIKSYLDEVLIDDTLKDLKTVFYPKVLQDLTNSQKIYDYYYIAGELKIIVEGLGEKDLIQNILIYYE